EELENLLAGRAGPGPDEVTVDAGANLFADGHAGQQPPANVAVGDRADDPPRMVLREQDSAHVRVQPPKRFLDRLGLGDGEMVLVLQFSGPKPDRDSARSGMRRPKNPHFPPVRYGRGANHAS